MISIEEISGQLAREMGAKKDHIIRDHIAKRLQISIEEIDEKILPRMHVYQINDASGKRLHEDYYLDGKPLIRFYPLETSTKEENNFKVMHNVVLRYRALPPVDQ